MVASFDWTFEQFWQLQCRFISRTSLVMFLAKYVQLHVIEQAKILYG